MIKWSYQFVSSYWCLQDVLLFFIYRKRVRISGRFQLSLAYSPYKTEWIINSITIDKPTKIPCFAATIRTNYPQNINFIFVIRELIDTCNINNIYLRHFPNVNTGIFKSLKTSNLKRISVVLVIKPVSSRQMHNVVLRSISNYLDNFIYQGMLFVLRLFQTSHANVSPIIQEYSSN